MSASVSLFALSAGRCTFKLICRDRVLRAVQRHVKHRLHVHGVKRRNGATSGSAAEGELGYAARAGSGHELRQGDSGADGIADAAAAAAAGLPTEQVEAAQAGSAERAGEQ